MWRRGVAASVCALAAASGAAAGEYGRAPITDSRNPPLIRALGAPALAQVELGHAVFNTHFTAAGLAPSRRDGLGPLFNAAACDVCHTEGAHGRGPTGDGALPVALVVELSNDPVYGRTFNTRAIEGFAAEGEVSVRYRDIAVRYRDGSEAHLRAPRYEFSRLQQGPLAAATTVEPRIAPALFGAGMLEAVQGVRARFGWQNTARDVRDQTAQAFSRDMGLSSIDIAHDDCTAAEHDCRQARNGGIPEVGDEFLQAVVEFQRSLAVPAPLAYSGNARVVAERFAQLGCAACHQPLLHTAPVSASLQDIHPYSDLQLHRMGGGLADHRADGSVAPTAFRTAPLWGINYRLTREKYPTFLHDGRGRSLEEAILWHDGEAAAARQAFANLPAASREELLSWIATL